MYEYHAMIVPVCILVYVQMSSQSSSMLPIINFVLAPKMVVAGLALVDSFHTLILQEPLAACTDQDASTSLAASLSPQKAPSAVSDH